MFNLGHLDRDDRPGYKLDKSSRQRERGRLGIDADERHKYFPGVSAVNDTNAVREHVARPRDRATRDEIEVPAESGLHANPGAKKLDRTVRAVAVDQNQVEPAVRDVRFAGSDGGRVTPRPAKLREVSLVRHARPHGLPAAPVEIQIAFPREGQRGSRIQPSHEVERAGSRPLELRSSAMASDAAKLADGVKQARRVARQITAR